LHFLSDALNLLEDLGWLLHEWRPFKVNRCLILGVLRNSWASKT